MPLKNSFALLEDLDDAVDKSPARETNKKKKKKNKSKASQAQAEGGASQSGNGSEAQENKNYVKNPIVWIDMEMTGLDAENDHILEIAVLITDGELNAPHLEGPDIAIHQPDEVLDNMNEWSTAAHSKSRLTQKCKESKVSLKEAESQVMDFLEKFTEPMSVKGGAQYKAHLAGNSVYMDQAFLKKHMPRIFAHLHWRLIDVSTLLELARRWFPEEFKKAPKKKVLHTAMADIRESLNELKFYRRHIFKQPGLTYQEYLDSTGKGKAAGAAKPEEAANAAEE